MHTTRHTLWTLWIALVAAANAAAAQPGSPSDRPPADAPCPTPAELHGSLKPLAEISLSVHATGKLPRDCFDSNGDLVDQRIDLYRQRTGTSYQFEWEASQLGHNPLYFEDVPLERHGHAVRPLLQPALSGARFVGDAIVLPYKMGLDHPREYEYTLGHIRPGTCAPALREHLPWSWKGAALQAAATTGVVFMFP